MAATATRRQTRRGTALPVPVALLHVALVCAAVYMLQQPVVARPTPESGVQLNFVCDTSASSPDLQDAIGAVLDMLRGGDICNFNNHGSQCTTTNSYGGASIGMCAGYEDCLPNSQAARHYWDLILKCATNDFGGTKVGGQVQGFKFFDGIAETSGKLILF